MNSKDYFEHVAPQWDQMRQSFFSEQVREVAYATANVQVGRLAADIGAGTGFIAEGLVRKGLRVIAVDPSEAMVEAMKGKLKAFHGIEYQVGESEHLPIEDNTVDYVFANMCLHHVESPSQAIREMARVLRTGGKVVITDLDEHGFEFLKTEHHDRWMGFKREEVKQWLEKAGLKKARVDCVGENCCAQSSGEAESATVSIFVAYAEK